jgi:gluconolactonase
MPEGFEIFDERFKTLLLPDSKLEKLASGCVWNEGPVYLPDGSLIWSDIPGNRLMRWPTRIARAIYSHGFPHEISVAHRNSSAS